MFHFLDIQYDSSLVFCIEFKHLTHPYAEFQPQEMLCRDSSHTPSLRLSLTSLDLQVQTSLHPNSSVAICSTAMHIKDQHLEHTTLLYDENKHKGCEYFDLIYGHNQKCVFSVRRSRHAE